VNQQEQDNSMLGSFVLDGLPPAAPGELQIEVSAA
jgi:molecular chaperone DnaK (HSP70)